MTGPNPTSHSESGKQDGNSTSHPKPNSTTSHPALEHILRDRLGVLDSRIIAYLVHAGSDPIGDIPFIRPFSGATTGLRNTDAFETDQ